MTGCISVDWVVTDACSGRTEVIPSLASEQALKVEGLDAFSRVFPVPIRGINSDNDSVFTNETLLGYCKERGIEFTRSWAYRKERSGMKKDGSH